jgi:glutaredoxin 3
MTMAVKIYTTRTCGYCQAALRLLRAKDIAFEQIDVTGNNDIRQWLVTATGRTTVPQIFIGDQAIGGYTDLAALEQSGKLQQMLAPSPS